MSYLNGNLTQCVRACVWFFRDIWRIDTQHGLYVTSSVNRLRPVERSQCERLVSQCNGAKCKPVLLQTGENCNRDASNVGEATRKGSREQKMCLCFRGGKETTEDEPRSGRPPISRTLEMIEKVRQMLAQKRSYRSCTFCGRECHQRSCDSRSAIDSTGGLC